MWCRILFGDGVKSEMSLTLPIPSQAAVRGISGVPQALIVPTRVSAVTGMALSEFPLLFVSLSVAEGPPFPPQREHTRQEAERALGSAEPWCCGQRRAVRFPAGAHRMNAEHRVSPKRIVAFLGAGVNYLNAMCFQP